MQSHRDDKPLSLQMTQASKYDERLRAIAYSIDALIPDLYFWFGSVKIRIGGSLPEENYPRTLHSSTGFALVLPGYKIYTSY